MKNIQIITFIFLIMISLFIRIEPLDRVLEYHENVTRMIVSQPTLTEVVQCAGEDNTPPLYHVILKLVQSGIEGVHKDFELSRVINIFFGIIFSIIMTFYSFRRWGFRPALVVCLMGSFLYQFHSVAIWGRSSMLHILLSGFCFIFWLEILRKNNRVSNYVYFAIFSLLNLYTHYFANFLFISQVMYIFLCSLKKRNKELAINTTYVIAFSYGLYFPWFYHFIWERLFETEQFWIKPDWINHVVMIFRSFLSSKLLEVTLILVLLFEVFNRKDRLSLKKFFPLLFVIFTFIFLVSVKSILGTYVFLPRYFIGLFPGFLLIFAIWVALSKFHKLISIIFVFILFYLNTIVIHENFYSNKNWIHQKDVELKPFKCSKNL